MRAEQLAVEFPVVGMDTNALDAARLLAEQKLPGLIVADESGRPVSVLPGSQVLRFMVPRYVQEDYALARVLDEGTADKLCSRLGEVTVRQVLPKTPAEVPVVAPDATAMEVAAVMARMHSPVVAVVRDRTVIGAITTAHLLEQLLPSA
ncbi:MAG: CBS domain-containing protein [Actinomycetota bacterium]|nr:CBS domain-containing protein [Actinomycetota bacterium]